MFLNMKDNYQLFINNEWCDASDGGSFTVHNPSTGKALAKVAAATVDDVDRAVKAARAAFDEGTWAQMGALERGRIIRKCAEILMCRIDEFAMLETLNVGKPITESTSFDIPMTAECFEFYANFIAGVQGDCIPTGGGLLDYTLKEPIGVVGAITPWNFPIALAVRKLAPALAAGNTVVIKPSTLAPLTTILLGEVFLEAGIPAGVVNIVSGLGSVVGDAISNHPLVDKLSFTGSTDIGTNVMRSSAGCIRSTSLELGGKSPGVVLKDADLDGTVKAVLFGAFLNQGECCCALTRVLVDSSIHDVFVKKLVEATKKIRVGIGTDPSTQMGPMISIGQRKTVLEYIHKGIAEGATLLCGGGIPDISELKDGYFIEPTIFDNVTSNMTIYREEIFGPVLTVSAFDGDNALIEAANDSDYGLSASIFTEDLKKGHTMARKIKAGTVWLNIHNFVSAQAPYGGYKRSGLGRELGKEGLEAYMETKNVIAYIDSNPFSWY